MGPLRRGLIALAFLAPSSALAGTCADARPNWVPGTQVSALSEALSLFSTPVALILILATVICLRFRSQWGAVVVVVLWTILASVLAFTDFGGRASAMSEGCIGSPAVFIAIVSVISVGLILYTAPRADTSGPSK